MAKSLADRPSRKSASKPHSASPSSEEIDPLSFMDSSIRKVFEEGMMKLFQSADFIISSSTNQKTMAKSLADRISWKSVSKPHIATPSSEKFDTVSTSLNPSNQMLFEELIEVFKEVMQKFQSSESVIDMLEPLKDLEPFIEKSVLGVCFWTIAKNLHDKEYEDSYTVFYLADRALRIMTCNNSSRDSITIVEILQILSSACFKLNRLDESLKYLNWAVRNLENMKGGACQDNHLVLLHLQKSYLQLYDLNLSMVKNEGCIAYLSKNLVLAEKIWGKHSRELANANLVVSCLYVFEMKYQEAIHFCLKALALYLTCSGDNTHEVAECSNYLGVIYHEIGENETAFEHNRLSQKLWKKLGFTSLLIKAEIHGACLLSELGRSEEAVKCLRDIIPRTEENSKDRTNALTHLAEAFIKQEKFVDALECAEIVSGILDDKESSIVNDAVTLSSITEVYTELFGLETALSLMQKALTIMQAEQGIPISILNKLVEEVSGKIVSLLLETSKFEEAIPYLEVDVEKTKMSFGSKHLKVGEVYDRLGYAYLSTNKLHLSAQVFGYTKDIFDEALGPLHDDSIMTCKLLCTAYVAMGSYSLAITFLEEAIKRMEEVDPNAQDYLAEATIFLDELNEMASGEAIDATKLGANWFCYLLCLREKEVVEDDELLHKTLKEKAMIRLNISKWKKKKAVNSGRQYASGPLQLLDSYNFFSN